MMTDHYQPLAPWYDHLQHEISPDRWADFLLQLDLLYRPVLSRLAGDGRDGRPLVLDLGCGTGSICLALEQRGYDPIGVDQSAAMLQLAREKATAAESHGLFLLQDISRFELYGTVDLITCLLDTVNHLVRPAQVERLFRLCANYLNPGCLFIFDCGTEHHFRQTLGNHLFYQDLAATAGQPALTLFWQNQYQPRTGISRANLTLFTEGTPQSPGLYRRSDVQIVERYYDHDFLLGCARSAGLEWLACHGELSLKAPARRAERHFYVFRRPARDL